jgi:hypothetical protein
MNSVQAIVNGRQAMLPDMATADEIRQAGGVKPGRRIIRRTREGNYPVSAAGKVQVNEGSVFVDAPARAKGGLKG